MKPIALQLFSLRKKVYPGGDDLPGVLRTVAEIGYKGVEFAGLHGNNPKEIAKILEDLDLAAASSHTDIPTPETVQQVADTELTLGNKRVISGLGPDRFQSVEDCRKVAEEYQRAAELLKPYGMTFGFHTHWWEFLAVDGRRPYDILLDEAPDVFNELDVYWCAWAREDPAKVVSEYKARMPMLHLKDGLLKEGEKVHTAVGSGKLDFYSIVGAADPDVLEWLVVELDASYGDMLADVKESYRYLTSNGLAIGSK